MEIIDPPKKPKTKEKLALMKRRAFEIYSSNPDISNTKLAKEVGTTSQTIPKWMETEEWTQWSKKLFHVIDAKLKNKIVALDDKIVTYIDNLLTGNLNPDQYKGAAAVINLYKSRLEMAGFINKRAGIEINNNLIAPKQVNNLVIEKMDENQLFKYITMNEVPKNIDDMSEKETEGLDLESLGIKTIS